MAWRQLKVSSAGAALQRRRENLREGRRGEDGGRASLGEVWTGGGSERVGLFGTFVCLWGHLQMIMRVHLHMYVVTV